MSNDLGSTDLLPRSEQDGEIVADTIAPVDGVDDTFCVECATEQANGRPVQML
jgi:hypothetical protein